MNQPPKDNPTPLLMPETVTLYKVSIPNVGTMLAFTEPVNPDCVFVSGQYTLSALTARQPVQSGDIEVLDMAVRICEDLFEKTFHDGSKAFVVLEAARRYQQGRIAGKGA